MICARHNFPGRRQAGFTLVEVILAIVIALGILVVLLGFYQQATHLRAQAIEETERLAAVRLVMDRLTGELRAVQPESCAGPHFVGRSNSIEFVKADVPPFALWTGGALGRAPIALTDLRLVKYQLQSSDGTNAAGLVRSEEPMVVTPFLRPRADDTTNAVGQASSFLVLEAIQALRFRYWSGTNWLDSWTGSGPPPGVEVTLGPDPLTNSTEVADVAADLFRRVISLANAGYRREMAADPTAAEEEAP